MANQIKPSPVNNSFRIRLVVIIGLFVLVCLFVGVAATAQTLEANQRWVLIALVVVFAVAGLSLSIFAALRQSGGYVGSDSRELGWRTSSTESQRRKLNDNLLELIRALKLSDAQVDDVFSAYVVAQDLALRQIQQETRENLLRHQSGGGTDFDAILFRPDAIVCIELAFVVAADVPQTKIDEILSRIDAAKKTFERAGQKTNLRLLFVLITQLDQAGEAQLRSSLVKKFSATPVNVDIRLFDFEDLQKSYTQA